MQIKHIDNVLTNTLRDLEGWKVLNLLVFIIIFFFDNKESAPCSILTNILRKSLSTNVKNTFRDFFKPKYCVIYNAPYSFLRKIAMQIKYIDNVLTITYRDLEG